MLKLHTLSPCLIALTALCGTGAQAGVVTYQDFSDTTGLTTVGAARTETTADGTVMRITPDALWQSGAFYSTNSLQLGNNATFSTSFQFRMTPSGIPADGLAFVLAASPNGMGESGAGMGYQGVQKSVIVEFDTYDNGWSDGFSNNHVAVSTNGSTTPVSPVSHVYGNRTCPQAPTAGCLSNGGLWTATIGYDGAKLSVTLRDSQLGTDFVALSDFAIDIASILGSNQAYAGFTAATGAAGESHDILNWTFADSAQIPADVPEPGSVWILGLGLAGLAARRALKRRA